MYEKRKKIGMPMKHDSAYVKSIAKLKRLRNLLNEGTEFEMLDKFQLSCSSKWCTTTTQCFKKDVPYRGSSALKM